MKQQTRPRRRAASPRIRRILVPTDCSDLSVAGLTMGLELARKYRASVVLLMADDRDIPAPALSALEVQGRDPGREQRRASLKMMKDFLAEHAIRPTGIVLDVRTGPPAETIVQACADRKSDIIVMSTHGRTGLSHALIGSVAEKVVRLAPCPVLTVKPMKETAGT